MDRLYINPTFRWDWSVVLFLGDGLVDLGPAVDGVFDE